MKKLLIFDFDGVLEDTFELTFEFFKEQLPSLTQEKYRGWFDGNVHRALDAQDVSAVDAYMFYKKYAKALQKKNLSPVLKEMLTALHTAFTFAIVSSNHDDALNEYLARNNIATLFNQVWGMKKSTSKVEKLEALLTLHALPKKDSWFITDTLGDIREAHMVGVESIAVTWGFHPKERLKQGNPAMVVDTPQELLHFLGA